jgi:DNA repair photolyase
MRISLTERLHVDVRTVDAKSILSRTSGFIAEAGFTHSLSPARNCTFGCTYCYVPTLGVFGGLTKDDWRHWGAFTTFKANAPELLGRALTSDQVIYCSPLVDPYQPAESVEAMMPRILDVLISRPPRVFAVQTRGPLIARDLDRLVRLSERTIVRIGFSLTTNREDVRRRYEPHCATITARLEAIGRVREAGLDVYATLAPILPCDPEELARLAVEATGRDVIADPLHSRENRAHGAVTRAAACRISERVGEARWHEADFQAEVLARMRREVERHGRRFGVGVAAFSWLAAV